MGHEQTCVDGLIADIRQINESYITRGDYRAASEHLHCALTERHYDLFHQQITDRLHMGESFTQSVDKLLVYLERGDQHKIDLFLRLTLAFGAQTRLPDGSSTYTGPKN